MSEGESAAFASSQPPVVMGRPGLVGGVVDRVHPKAIEESHPESVRKARLVLAVLDRI